MNFGAALCNVKSFVSQPNVEIEKKDIQTFLHLAKEQNSRLLVPICRRIRALPIR